jgi:hypothetical protein
VVDTGMLSMRQLMFKVDRIGAGREVSKRMQGAWVTGSVMTDMISAAGRAQAPKPKFAYDHKPVSRHFIRFAGLMSRMSQGMSQGL